MHGRTFQHWSDEGTGLEKQSNSAQQSLCKDRLQVTSLKKQNILRVYFVVTTGIGKSPDNPCEFQLQPNEEIIQHAHRQVPINPQGALCQETKIHQGNQFIAEPVKEVTECVSILEIVDEKVPADFNTGNDHSPQETTGRPDGFLDGFSNGFKIVDEVPADLNTEDKVKDHLQGHLQDTNGPFPGLTMAYDGNQPNNFKSPTSLHIDTWKKGLEAVLQPNSTLVMIASTRSEKEVEPLQNSTLVMFKSKTSTGHHQERISSREDIVQSTQHAQCAQCAQTLSNVYMFLT